MRSQAIFCSNVFHQGGTRTLHSAADSVRQLPHQAHSRSTSSSSSTRNRKPRLSLATIHSSIHTCATWFPRAVPDVNSGGRWRRRYPVDAAYQSRALTHSSIYFSYKLRPTFSLRSRFPLHVTLRILPFFWPVSLKIKWCLTNNA